jgi:Plavaka transposase
MADKVHTKNIIETDPQTHGSMFVPIILGSDKTTVSVATGHNEFWPVYISIGNIHNSVRRAHRNGVALLGFLPIPKSQAFIFVMSLPLFLTDFFR